MPLTYEQQNAIAAFRAYVMLGSQPCTAKSPDQRAQLPDPARVPKDVAVYVETSPYPLPLVDSSALKTPERVPVYFYALRSDRAEEVADTRAIIFIHGGGNVWGHPTDEEYIHVHTQLLRAVASYSGDASKCVLIAPSYRLATVPENTFPAALQDLVAAYDYVLEKGYQASNIVIAGDSAGGNHGRPPHSLANTVTNIRTAVILTHLILQSNRPPPRGIVPIAPDSILERGQLSELAKANGNTDVLTPPMLEQVASAYLGDSGFEGTDPLVSGAFVPFTTSWPKTLILVGSGDVLIDASREIQTRLSDLNVPVELVEYDKRPHAWWFMPDYFLEDIHDAAERVARLVLE